MNPYLTLLMMLMRGQRGSRSFARGETGMTPEAQTLLSQLRMNYLNPGNGRIGNEALGTGLLGQYGWGGFYRGAPLPSYAGVAPNVGNISMMRGDAPAMNTSPAATLARMFGPGPSWGASNWLSDLINMSPQNADPYPTGQHGDTGLGGMLTNEVDDPRFHGGGAGMLGFLSGPQSLQGMDAMFSGAGRGGAGSGAMDFSSNYLV